MPDRGPGRVAAAATLRGLAGGARRRVGRAARALRGADQKVPQLFEPGTFYSPVVDPGLVLAEPDRTRVWPSEPADPPGVDLRPSEQLALLGSLAQHRLPTATDRDDEHHYDPANDQFPPQDAALLYAMVRHLRPRRMVEVGCGWSTTVTARAIRDGRLGTELTCIDPYPRPFLAEVSAIRELRAERVELTPHEVFAALERDDVLFIDSSHVAKTGSDVVHLLLHVVPTLAPGVVVHVHDVFLPEDYPHGWVKVGFGWNEQYLLHALLVGNVGLEVVALNRWLSLRHPTEVEAAFGPVAHTGSSAWLRTTVR